MATRPSPRPDRSSAPASSPRPQQRDQAKADAFFASQSDNDNDSAAAVQQGIAAIAAAAGDGGGKRVFAQTPMLNAANDVVGTYGGQPEIPSLPMTPFIINEIMGTSEEPLLPPPPVPPQGLFGRGTFGRSAPGAFEFSENPSLIIDDPLSMPGPQVPFMLGGNVQTRGTTAPTAGTAPFVDRTSPPIGISSPFVGTTSSPTGISDPVQSMSASPSLPGMPVPQGGRFPVTTVPGMMDQPPSRSALMALRPQEVGTAPTADTSSAPRPVAAPIPAPQPAITPEAIAGDISQSAASAERPSFNPLDFTMVGMAKRLIDSLAGGGGGGSLGSTRPETRPSVMNVMRGEGDDAQMYMAATRDMPRFGISAGDEMVAPDYGPFSLRGLTSTDPGNVMRNIQGAERMARAFPTETGGDEAAPVAPMAPPVDPAAMPTERPAWWPAYLPWPPTPRTAAPMPTYRPPPVAPVMPGQQYSTSYSGLQGAISGAGNPLMMGIGGMIRRS